MEWPSLASVLHIISIISAIISISIPKSQQVTLVSCPSCPFSTLPSLTRACTPLQPCRACGAGEVDAARRIAERALVAIPMTEEGEKFNVWVALLNLEAAYGGEDAEDKLMDTFKRCECAGAAAPLEARTPLPAPTPPPLHASLISTPTNT